MPSRKKPGVAFWATVVVVVALVAYPLAWGPWLWLKIKHKPPRPVCLAADAAFVPLKALSQSGVLPDWYLLFIERCATSGVTINHGPKR